MAHHHLRVNELAASLDVEVEDVQTAITEEGIPSLDGSHYCIGLVGPALVKLAQRRAEQQDSAALAPV